jgi:hypothetical protein
MSHYSYLFLQRLSGGFGWKNAARCIVVGIAFLAAFWITLIDDFIALYLQWDLAIVALLWWLIGFVALMTIIGRSLGSILILRRNYGAQLICNVASVIAVVLSFYYFGKVFLHLSDVVFFHIHQSRFERLVTEQQRSASSVIVFKISAGGNTFRYFVFVNNAPIRDGARPAELLDLVGLDTFSGCDADARRLQGKFYAIGVGC